MRARVRPVPPVAAARGGSSGRGSQPPALGDRLGQRLALDELHGVVVHAALAADRIDRDDVGVVELGGGQGLGLEPPELGRVHRRRERQHLQRHATVQANAAPPRRRPPCRPGPPRAIRRKSPRSPIPGSPSSASTALSIDDQRRRDQRRLADELEAGQARLQVLGQLGMFGQQLLPRRRGALLGRGQVGVQDLDQPDLARGFALTLSESACWRSCVVVRCPLSVAGCAVVPSCQPDRRSQLRHWHRIIACAYGPYGHFVAPHHRLSIRGRSFFSARAHSRRTAPGLRPIARATSSQSRPSRVRSTTTSRWSAASSARASARMILSSRRWADWLGECPLGATRSSMARDDRAERVVQRLLAPDRPAAGRLEPADQVGQVPRQDLPQPGDQLRLGLALELVEVLMGFEQRFLDQVGGVRLAPQRGVDAGAGQQPQVVAIRLQQPVQGARGLTRASSINRPMMGSPSTMGGPSPDQSLAVRL